MRPRRIGLVLFSAVALDLLALILSGNLGLFGTAGRKGFAVRLVLLGLLSAGLWFRSRVVLLFGLCALPSLYQFQFAGGRINGDGIMYYPYVRSVWKDFDLDFTNEYDRFGLLDRGDLKVLTRTGLRRSIFSIGPAVVWTPFFALGEVAARIQKLAGFDVDLSGFGPHHRNAVAFGSFCLGFGALLLMHATLKRHFTAGIALGATLLVWGTTFLHWYMVQQPTMSHAPSAFAASLVVFLWDRARGARSRGGYLWLGLAIGLALCIRWQNGVLLLLPGVALIEAVWKKRQDLAASFVDGLVLMAGTFITALPQMAAWKALYDEWLLRHPPHGADFLRLDHPFFWETLFSSRHGLLSWTPIFWAAYVGFAILLWRRQAVAWTLLAPLVVMTYVNFCSGDWWAGGSFSNRRFDSLLPILAFGIAASLDLGRRFVGRHPSTAVAAVTLAAVLWNATLMAQVRQGLIPRDDTVSFPQLVGGSARVFEDAAGFPTTWPASWIFSARHDLSPGQFDLVVGKYMFYRQNNLGGRIDVGSDAHAGLLGEGFSRVEQREGNPCRRLLRDARVLAPLDVAEAFDLHVLARSAFLGSMDLAVNGRRAGTVNVTPSWTSLRVAVAKGFFRDGVNEITLRSDAPETCVAVVEFRRLPRR